MTAAPIAATCTATFPLAGAPAAPCDRQPHATGLHTAEVAGVGFVWSDRGTDPLPDWEQATLDAVRAVYGDDVPRTRARRIEAVGCAMLTLRAHEWLPGRPGEPTEPDCHCGWVGPDHARHVAEQLYATGALDPNAAPVVRFVRAAKALVERIGPGRRVATNETRELLAAYEGLYAGGGT